MRKYMSIFNPSHEKLIEFINRYYTRRGWRIISRRRVKTLLATGRYLLTIDYRKKDINNEK